MGGMVCLEESVRKYAVNKGPDVQHNDHPPPLRNYSWRVVGMSICHG